MREVYNLSNDNEVNHTVYSQKIGKKNKKKIKFALPKIYKLFGFMSCATSLDAVWSRRHYDESNKIN